MLEAEDSDALWREPEALVHDHGVLVATETMPERASVVVALRGELDLATAPALGARLVELLQRPLGTLTLDLAELTFVDSSGLDALNAARKAADQHRVAFRLAAVPEQARRVLDVSQMSKVFDLD